jgi:exopolysaccharide biosynthesis polyprenyl glycosylphosphotransferase
LALALKFDGYASTSFSLASLFSVRMMISDFVVITATIFIWHFLFQQIGLYETKRFGRRVEECIDILKATSLGSCIISCIISLFFNSLLNGYFIIVFWALSALLIIVSRMTMRLILKMVRYRDRNLRHIVILGTNDRAVRFAEQIRSRKEMGYSILGFVDNECKAKDEWIKLISNFDNFSEVLDRYIIDEVIVALPVQCFYPEVSKVLTLCAEQGIKVRFIMGMLFDQSHTKTSIEYMDGGPFLTQYMGPPDGFLLRIKRIIDIVVSALAMILLVPLFVVVGILIKIDSRGPIFFVQERVGYNKRLFKFYKFRTMTIDAEKRQAEIEHLNEVSGPVFKIKEDPRVTKLGKILRKTSIDELPQFLNVLKGEMSLVGPRPLPVRDYKRFEQNWQKRRLSIKPGITCLWQIKGRSKLSFEKWIELDMEYIDQWSLLLDLKILLKTIPVVIKGAGAM